jgi:L-amino acid N-acyltransferase YncA
VRPVIRPAEPRDAEGCLAVYAPYVATSAATFETTPPDPQDMRERIAEAKLWLVAERDGRIAGYAYASPHRGRAAYRWAADVAVYVDRAAHRRGVGRELYEALLPLIARQNLHVACAGITLPNEASVALHEAVGFELVGIYRAIGFKGGAWRDVGWWQARLLPTGDGRPAEPLGPQRLPGG